MKQIKTILTGLMAISTCVMAQPLPVTPPAGYDQSGRYPAGTVQWNISYYSSVAGSNVNMHVYTPPNYNSNQKYGVVYCYQGISAGADTTFASWNVYANGVADNLIGEGKIKPVIIVALDDQFAGTYSDVNGMTINDAIPYIDSHYSTYADADHRGVYGYSWGGGYAFNVGCGNLDTFHYIAPSSAAPSKAGDDVLFPNGGAEARQKLKLLLIACGNADYLGLYGPSEGAHNYCVSNGVPHAWWPVKNGNHDAGSVWRPHMWNFLQMADAAGISAPPLPHSAYAQNEAENFDQRRGVTSEDCSEGGKDIGSIQNGDYVVFNNVDFSGGATNFQARVASATSGGNIEVRLDSTNGTLVGTCAVSGTGGWQTWTTQSNTVSSLTGVHNVYLMFTGGSGYLFNVNWWKFGGPSSPVAAPLAPGGLVATAGIERVALRWTAASTATSYNVKWAATSGGTYTTIASVAGTNYTDRSVFGGTTNYYKVSALNVGGESADSVQASVTPTVTVPSPWLTRDVGVVGLPGGASFTDGIFTVTGSGADIGGTSDAFRFVQVATNGDCTIVARVASLEDYINSWSKAGVMIRESLETNAASAFIAVTPGNGVVFQYRSSTGGGSISNNVTGMSAPYWVKLVRSGNMFTGYRSADGSSWTQVGSTTISMSSTAYVGLALTSHNLYTLCTATFDRVTGPGWNPPAAPTPTGLVATAGYEKVTLTWQPASNATGYNVKRATTSGGPYTNIATVTATNYTDTRVVGRTTYYYVVSALSTAGESANSVQASATPIVNAPVPWITQDIGDTGLSGSLDFTNGVFTVKGSGGDIWNSADAFRFVYVATNSTNFTVTARVASLQNVDGWSKAGVMVRASLDANAVNALAAVTPGNGVTWQYRSTTGGGCSSFNTTGLVAPYWVRVVRSGDTFTGYRSPDGTNWTQMGSTTLAGITTAYVGLAVTSHNNSSLCTATFDNVSVPGWPPPLLSVNASAVSATQVSLTWNALTNATSYNVKRSVISGGPYSPIATGLTATNYLDTGLPVSVGYYYVVSAMVGGSETLNSPEAMSSIPKLTGTIIGTAGSWGGSGSTIAKVFDNDLTTFFDAPDGNGAWAGLDFGVGVSNVITQIKYCPRSGSESRMVGGVFQGANQANFSDAVTLATVATQPTTGVFTSVSVSSPTAFRYVRYLSPSGGFGNVAEVEFYGYPVSTLGFVTPTPSGLTATAVSSSQINLVWNVLTNATSYNVKRSLTNGGSYTTIASGVTATNYQNGGLAGGTLYYYVVSAVVGGTNSADSASAAAATLSPTEGSLVHRYSFSDPAGSSIADSVGGPVWNGTLPNGGTLAGGQLTLATASSQYASLPTGIVGTLSNFTIVTWVRLNSTTNWSRIFDFGSDSTTNMFITPQNGGDGRLRFAITTNGGGSEEQINCNSTLSAGVWYQVAVTLTGSTGILYLNGVPVGTNNAMTFNPSMLGSTGNNYLGRSQYPDPYFDGVMEEFRIYNVGLSAAEVAATAALGSSQQLSTSSPSVNTALTGANLTLSWPLACAGYTLQSRTNLTSGDWLNVTSTAPQIVGGNWQVALPLASAGSEFYRLMK